MGPRRDDRRRGLPRDVGAIARATLDGMTTFRQAAIRKWARGAMTDEEVFRVTPELSLGRRYEEMTPSWAPTAAKAATAASTWAVVWAAESCTRMRAFPLGTTG